MIATDFPDGCVSPATEALIVLHVFDAPDGYRRGDLARKLNDIPADAVSASITSLAEAGVIREHRKRLYPCAPLKRLAVLDLIGG